MSRWQASCRQREGKYNAAKRTVEQTCFVYAIQVVHCKNAVNPLVINIYDTSTACIPCFATSGTPALHTYPRAQIKHLHSHNLDTHNVHTQ